MTDKPVPFCSALDDEALCIFAEGLLRKANNLSSFDERTLHCTSMFDQKLLEEVLPELLKRLREKL